MSISSWTERRINKGHDLSLRRSFLFHVPKPFAYTFVSAGFVLAVLADILSSPAVWMGPVYLFLIAFAAWTISGFLAVAIGLLLITIRWAVGDVVTYPYGPEAALPNLSLRFLSVLMVVSFLIIARRSCEKEWRLARTDPLTGALNRQAFFETVEASQYDANWYALAYADLDGLKRCNDEKGHDAGDKGIKEFASCVQRTIRKGDVFARIGGDEFVIFMQVNEQSGGTNVAERLYQATCSANAQSVDALACSWGVLLLPPGVRHIDQELKAADTLMYGAKRSSSGIGVAVYCPNRKSFDVMSRSIRPDHKSVIRSSSRVLS